MTKVLILQDIKSNFNDKKKSPELYARKGQELNVNKVREDGGLIVAGKERGGVFILEKSDENKTYKILQTVTN